MLYRSLTSYTIRCLCLYNTIGPWRWLQPSVGTRRSVKTKLCAVAGNKPVCIKNKTGNVRITSHWGAFANHYCRGKATSTTHLSVCACVCVALLIQHATRVRHIVISFMASMAPPYFTTLSHKRHDFREKVTEHKMCILILSATFIWNISHSKNCYKCENVFT